MDDLKNQIEKYLKGELSPSQMHELEMRALHDPFLSDALDGATSIDPGVFIEDIKIINKKVSKSSNHFYWPLRIAASILLIASISYLVMQFEKAQLPEQLALEESKPLKDGSSIVLDSGTKSPNIKDNLLSFKANEIKEKKPFENNYQKKDLNQPTEDTKIITLPEPVTTIGESNKPETTEEIATEKEIAFAEDRDDQSEKTTLSKADAIRSRSEASKQSSAPLPSSISGAGVSKKTKDFSASTSSNPKPIVGDVEFKKYLESNLNYPQEAIVNKIEGEVIVGFTVTMNGDLTDFIVERGIGYGCDEELIRLIKIGPAWEPAQVNGLSENQKTTVSFVFHTPK